MSRGERHERIYMSNDIGKGCIVLSIAGRDKGKYFLVIGKEDNYALIVDGKLRSTESPKRKKIKHLMYAGRISGEKLQAKIDSDVTLEDAEVRKAMNLFLTEEETL